MGSKLGGGDDDAIVDINITPFVDIILVVLIIFMVKVTYIVKQSIKVNLPEASTGEGTEDSSLAITMDAEKNLFLNGEPIDETGLRKVIREEKETAKQKKIDLVCLIGADHAVPHGDVVRIIDLVKSEGVSKFAINIDPVSAEENPEATRASP